ncbi:hypothetical protein HDU97_006118 [Phlyctochytrium planicorne]|nr:hypothetical protein HDU97_006118 [Phlyctochytrium planicorne]
MEPMSKKPTPPDVFEGQFAGEPPPDPQDNAVGSKKHKKSSLISEGFGNHPVVKQLVAANKKGIKISPTFPNTGNFGVASGAELRIEELDEELMRKRLESLQADLAEYKRKCLHYKSENEWYRTEIESTKKDTAEYIEYLHTKKNEKQLAIDTLLQRQKQDQEYFTNKRRLKEADNKAKIEGILRSYILQLTRIPELKALAVELEVKLEGKQQEIMHLSDVMVGHNNNILLLTIDKARRSRHEAEISRIRKEIADADAKHAQAVSDLERNLLEVRMKLQREADAKIADMECAAQEKAAKYLSDHTTALEAENRKLESQLRTCILTTQELILKKDNLEKENKELTRRLQVRSDILKVRVDSVIQAQIEEKRQRDAHKERIIALKSQLIGEALNSMRQSGRIGMPGDIDSPEFSQIRKKIAGSSAVSHRVRDNIQNSRGSGAGSRGASRGHTSNNVEKAPTQLIVLAGGSAENQSLLEQSLGANSHRSTSNSRLLAESDNSDDDEYII